MTGLVPRVAAVVLGVVVACVLWGMSQGAGLQGPDTGREPGHRTQAVVVDVVDGDTVRVKTRAGRELPRIRILGISAPEIPHPGKAGECYGGRATRHLARLLPAGTPVVLQTDPTQATTDSYGRLLRYVEAGGRDVGLEQIRSGAAAAREGSPPVQRLEEYRQGQDQAEERGRGLWSACG